MYLKCHKNLLHLPWRTKWTNFYAKVTFWPVELFYLIWMTIIIDPVTHIHLSHRHLKSFLKLCKINSVSTVELKGQNLTLKSCFDLLFGDS